MSTNFKDKIGMESMIVPVEIDNIKNPWDEIIKEIKSTPSYYGEGEPHKTVLLNLSLKEGIMPFQKDMETVPLSIFIGKEPKEPIKEDSGKLPCGSYDAKFIMNDEDNPDYPIEIINIDLICIGNTNKMVIDDAYSIALKGAMQYVFDSYPEIHDLSNFVIVLNTESNLYRNPEKSDKFFYRGLEIINTVKILTGSFPLGVMLISSKENTHEIFKRKKNKKKKDKKNKKKK